MQNVKVTQLLRIFISKTAGSIHEFKKNSNVFLSIKVDIYQKLSSVGFNVEVKILSEPLMCAKVLNFA